MMVYRFVQVVCVIYISLLLILFNSQQSIRTSQVPTQTAVNLADLRVFPDELICDKREESVINDGPTWMGITVGKSTLKDVKQLLSTFSDRYEFFEYDNFEVGFIDPDAPKGTSKIPYVRVCLIENTVQVLLVSYPYPFGPNLYLSDLIAKYGEPEATTWTDGPATRVIFWFQQGTAARISVVPNESGYKPTYELVAELIYFPYQEVKDFDNRWPYNQTRKLNPYLPSPEDPTVDFGLENPFDYRAIIATITAEPSRTPTPTFVPVTITPNSTVTP